MDSESPIKHEKYVENDEEFDFTTYNDITVIIHVKSGYYNATKICKDNGKLFTNLNRNQGYQNKISRIEGVIQKRITYDLCDFVIYNKNPTFELREKFTGKVTGTYVHPLLVNYVCMWANEEYALKVDMIMNIINKELHLRNMKLDEKIKEMDDKVKDLCLPINRSKKGYIYVTKHEFNGNVKYRITCKKVPKVNKKNVVKEYSFTNADDVRKILKVNVGKLNKVLNGLGNGYYEIYDFDKLDKLIMEIKNNMFKEEDYYDSTVTLDQEISNLKEQIKSSSNKTQILCRAGKLYELLYVKENGEDTHKLWNKLPQSFLNSHFDTHADHGIDIVNEDFKFLCQLKYYPNSYLSALHLHSFINFIENFDEEDYQYYLICPSTTIINEYDEQMLLDFGIEILRWDCEELDKLVNESIKKMSEKNRLNAPKNSKKETMEKVEFIKKLIDNSSDKVLTKKFICDEINKAFDVEYQAINHLVNILINQYPEYDSRIENKKAINDITDDINSFIKENICMADTELTKLINEKYGVDMTLNAVSHRKTKLRKKDESLPKKNYGVNRELSTKINEFIKENYSTPTDELTKIVNEKFNLNLSSSTIAGRKRELRKNNIELKIHNTYSKDERNKIRNIMKDNIDKKIEEIQKIILDELNLNVLSTYLYKLRTDVKDELGLRTKEDMKHRFTEEEESKIISCLENNKNMTGKELKKLLKDKYDIDASLATIYKRLKQM